MPSTLEPPRSVPAQDESDALFEEARRRQRRRRRGIAVVLLAAALAAVLFLRVGGSGPKLPGSGAQPGHAGSHPAPGSSPALAAIPGADTSLLIWPGVVTPAVASPPARIVNLDTGRSVLRPIPGLALVGLYLLVVGQWLVYQSNDGVAAIRSDLRGAPRVIGHADAYRIVPGVRDQVWFLDGVLYPVGPRGPSRVAPSVQSVSLPSGRRSPKLALPRDTSGVVEGTDRGLLLFVGAEPGYRLELWKPGSPPVVLAHETSGIPKLFAPGSDIVAFGSDCPSRGASPGDFSVGLCRALTIIDLARGERWSLPAPAGTRGWAPHPASPERIAA